MAQRCELCGKGPQAGRAVSFSKKATPRRFLPNLSHRHIVVNGKAQHLKVCTNCVRTLNKTEKGRFAKSLTKTA
ncbi:MAG: 50S ribosomal protein L28 [Chloroflexota bacterium]|nr:MAG: 50S ribosomal protein L28 [Chloroflexota bacterium]